MLAATCQGVEYQDPEEGMGRPKWPDRKPLPVTILTGFLGAGKTTLLNHLLTTNHDTKFAIIQNEYGAVGIDHALTKINVNSDEKIFLAANGCICCNVTTDLDKIMVELLQMHFEDPFDGIVVETTGLARPSPLVKAFLEPKYSALGICLDAVVTVIDAKHLPVQLTSSDSAEAHQVDEQIALADKLLLNKCDLV
jgi:G3E family GTPase